MRKKRTVGLSIGTRVMAAAQNRITASGAIATEQIGLSDIPEGAIDNYGITDPEAVSKAIRNLLNASKIRGRELTLAISESSVITRILTLPPMPEDEMLEVLRGEVENYAILAGDEAVLDFQIIDQRAAETAQQVEVLVVAAPGELISSYKAIMEDADLKLLAVEIMPTAAMRTLIGSQPDVPVMLANIEESDGTIAVTRNGVIRFIHRIGIGTDGLPENDSALETLANEIKSSLDYYRTSSSGREDPGEIVLYMDGVDSDLVCEGLKEYLTVPIASPQNLDIADESTRAYATKHSLSSYAAVGAATRTGGSDGAINLLRPQRVEKPSLRKRLAVFCLCFSSIILLSICANLLLNAKANAIIQQIISTQQVSGGSDMREWMEISVIKADTLQVEKQVNRVKDVIISTRSVDWSGLLREIGAIIPTTMWMTELSWEEGDEISLSGVAASHYSVFIFRDMLTDSPCFDSVRLVYAQSITMSGVPLVRFQILCGIEEIT